LERGYIAAIAGKHFVAQRNPALGDHQPDAHLFTVRPVIAGIAALGQPMLVREAGRLAAELGLIDAYERCRVRFAFPDDAAALLRYCLSCVLEEEMPTQATHAFLTPPQIARILRVRPDKVRAWIRRGRLRASDMAENRGGPPRYRVEWSDFHDFIQNRLVQPLTPRRRSRPTPEGVTEYFQASLLCGRSLGATVVHHWGVAHCRQPTYR